MSYGIGGGNLVNYFGFVVCWLVGWLVGFLGLLCERRGGRCDDGDDDVICEVGLVWFCFVRSGGVRLFVLNK